MVRIFPMKKLNFLLILNKIKKQIEYNDLLGMKTFS